MSAEYDFKLKRIGQHVNEAPIVLWLATSDARELFDVMPFTENITGQEYDGWQKVTDQDFTDILEYYKNQVVSLDERMCDFQAEVDRTLKLMSQVSNIEIFNNLNESLGDWDIEIRQCHELQGKYRELISDFQFIRTLASPLQNEGFEIVCYFS